MPGNGKFIMVIKTDKSNVGIASLIYMFVFKFLESCTLEAVKKQYDNFCRIKGADFDELVNRFEQMLV